MSLQLKFVTNIIRPWEKLSKELSNKSVIDSNISDFITNAEDLSVRLSHFAEIAGKKSIRTKKSCSEFNTIVDIADSTKHDDLDDNQRNNKLSLSAMFEYRDDESFRFIRNRIVVNHVKYGKVDFLEVLKKAADFLILELRLNIFWRANIFEAPNIFQKKVLLDITYQNQIQWAELQLEIFKKNNTGELIPFDPPKLPFTLRNDDGIIASNFKDYIFHLLKSSLEFTEVISSIHGDENNDFIIKNTQNNETTKVKIVPEQFVLSNSLFIEFLKKIKYERIILVSEKEFNNDIKMYILTLNNVFLISTKNREAINIPIGFFKIKTNHSNLKIKSFKKISLSIDEDHFNELTSINGKSMVEMGNIFTLDKINLMSFPALCLSQVIIKRGKTNGELNLNYKTTDNKNFFIKVDEKFIKIGFEANFEWETEIVEKCSPILTFERTQMGISLWNLESNLGNIENPIPLKIPVIKYGNTTAFGMLN